jgi:hypothetical protein
MPRTRRGVLVEEMGQAYLADADGDEACTLQPLQAAAVIPYVQTAVFQPLGVSGIFTFRSNGQTATYRNSLFI